MSNETIYISAQDIMEAARIITERLAANTPIEKLTVGFPAGEPLFVMEPWDKK
jgi:hypothetical protein